MSTFGTESKDYPILEFNAANKAYQMTAFWGFRTFLTGTRSSLKNGGVSFQMEPFAPANTRELKTSDNENNKPKRILFVGANDVEIQEIDGAHGVTTNVNYFVLRKCLLVLMGSRLATMISKSKNLLTFYYCCSNFRFQPKPTLPRWYVE